MNVHTHEALKSTIWEIANRLRGPDRPPQYRLVMLPMVVLRRLDCVLEPTKDKVLKQYEKLTAQNMPESAMERLLGDSENIAPNLVSYINGFSPTARTIFERFKFTDQIEKLDASNRLFTIVKGMTDVDLHPDRIDNLQMGYVFEHLVMRFNEQANEEAGDHFTPRDVITAGDENAVGSKIAIVFNGSPLFSGDAGSGPSNIRRCSRIFENREFGFFKVTVERPLRMNLEASAERITRLDEQSAFANLATSKKRKDDKAAAREIEEGREQQDAIRNLLARLKAKGRYRDRKAFEADLNRAAKAAEVKLTGSIKKAIFAALGERDPEAEICRDAKGRLEPDSKLRDTDNIPLPAGTVLPLPMDFGPDKPNDRLIEAFRDVIDACMAKEVLPHVADAWVDYDKTKVGYEIPINRHFYVYKPPRPLSEIEADIRQLEGEIADLLKGLLA